MEEYLRIQFTHSTIPKYYKYFEMWFNALTDTQLQYYEAYMKGAKTPYQNETI